jgi:ceramide glucosyltransferase
MSLCAATHHVDRFILFIGLAGLATSTVYLCMVMVAAVRLARRARLMDGVVDGRRRALDVDQLPSITVMKPLHGPEPRLEENLRSFFEQDYHRLTADLGVRIEYLFCARSQNDAGLELVRGLAHEYPALAIRTFASGEPWGPNAKLCSLAVMGKAAATDLWVVSDSDVVVTSDYLRRVVAPFADERVGCVTCLYRGTAPGRGFWASLEAVGMSIEMSSGVAVSTMLGPMRFALGPTMVLRRECVQAAGGFDALVEYCSDDFVLGSRIAQQPGRIVELSSYVVDHVILNLSFADSVRHQVRWMKSTRCSLPKGHLGTGLTFAVPYGMLACAGAMLLGHSVMGLILLIFSVAGRMLQAFVVGRYVVREPRLWRVLVLFPIRDLMGFCFWAMSFTDRRILWRNEMYELQHGGRMRKI